MRRRSQIAALARLCQTTARWIGRPVARSHTTVVSRWFVMPMAATSRPARPAAASASRPTGIVLRDLAIRGAAHPTVVVEHHGRRAGRALVQGQDRGHGAEKRRIGAISRR
jgi:hypothetical protein